jgi:hypothetical protein
MAVADQIFDRDLLLDNGLVERCFSSCFSVAEMVKNAENLGYSFDYDNLDDLEANLSSADKGGVSFYVPDNDTGEIVELSVGEMELADVAGGLSDKPISILVNITDVVTVVAIAVAAIAVLVVLYGEGNVEKTQ